MTPIMTPSCPTMPPRISFVANLFKSSFPFNRESTSAPVFFLVVTALDHPAIAVAASVVLVSVVCAGCGLVRLPVES